MRVCSGAGCLRAIAGELRYCTECKPVPVEQDSTVRVHSVSDRERYAFLYSGSRWQRVRRQAVQAHPFCERCQLVVTELVDHIVPAGVAIQQVRDSGRYPLDKYAGFYLLSNMQGLCRPCHWHKTEEDKAHTGLWPDVLEKEALSTKRRWVL